MDSGIVLWPRYFFDAHVAWLPLRPFTEVNEAK